MDLPNAEFVTNDSAWCQGLDNRTTGRILITGTDSSSFDLILQVKGTRDTLRNRPSGINSISLDNDPGVNEYILMKIIEYHGGNFCETDLFDTLTMEVLAQPEITLETTYESLCSPAQVSFETDSGYSLYTWRFGDGEVSQTLSHHTTHTYNYDFRDVFLGVEEGDTIWGAPDLDTVYHILLIAESGSACSNIYSDSIRIKSRPVADFFASPAIQEYPDSMIFLINLTSLGNWSYLWDFGDGTSDTVKDPDQHIYDTYGFYDVQLTSYTPFCRDSITKRVQIMPPPPVALFEPDTSGCPPLEVTFRNRSLYADTYYWDFDDNTSSTEAAPTHSFTDSREYRVRMMAYGLSGTDTMEQIISISEPPTAQFDVDLTRATDLQQLFTFTNASDNASYYRWEFGDGTTSPEVDPTYTYGKAGTYTVTLYAWSEEDCADTLIKEDLIQVIIGEGELEFPTVFRWNGSGPTGGHWDENTLDNTVFHPRAVNVASYRLTVYTRWGERVFVSDDLYMGWDGYYGTSGELASQGVYIFQVEVTYLTGTKEEITGNVTFLH
jgi:PKD repeat protein